MSRSKRISFLILLTAMCVMSRITVAEERPVAQFRKQVLTDRYYADGINAGDINNDGHVDIVCGPFWFEGPEFKIAHEFYAAVPLPPEKSPSNSMFTFLYDWSGDGWLDILVLGRVHLHEAYWYENPAKSDGAWLKHFVFERVRGESPTLVDVDGDGRPELLTHWENEWGFLAPDWEDPRSSWKFHGVGHQQEWPQFYHGQGIGDLNSDGRLDIILTDGWYEQPAENPFSTPWTYHAGRLTDLRGGAQIFTADINEDGHADIVSALQAHEWGLSWFEQVSEVSPDATSLVQMGSLSFREHRLMGTREEETKYGVAFSQPHALEFADLNGDGRKDIIVGKRVWAHGPTGDVEPQGTPVLYWFEASMKDRVVSFQPHLIDTQSGVGTQIHIGDVNGDGRPDVLTASKLGEFLYFNELSTEAKGKQISRIRIEYQDHNEIRQ